MVFPFVQSIGQVKENKPQSKLQNEWRWVHYTTESGLPSNNIIAVAETEDSTVWVATTSGVAWYDGYQWHQIDSTKGLPLGIPQALNSAGDSTVLVVINKRLFRGSRNGFVNITPYHTTVSVTAAGKVFLRSADSIGIFKEGRFDYLPNSSGSSDPVSDNYQLWITKSGAVWLVTGRNLFKWHNQRWMPAIQSTTDVIYVNFLVEDQHGDGFASIGKPIEQRGLWTWENHSVAKASPSEKQDWLKWMDIGPGGEVIAIYKSGEIGYRSHGIWSLITSLPGQSKNASFVQFRDNGDLWIGTEFGLYLCNLHSSRWSGIRYDSSVRNRLHEIMKAKDGSLWLGTANGLEIYYPSGDHQTIIHVLGHPIPEVTGIIQDDIGNVWISSGVAFDGTYRWNGTQWNYFRVDSSIPSLKFHKIFKDSHGRLWFVGLAGQVNSIVGSGTGVEVYEHGKFSRSGSDEPTLRGRVYTFAEGADSSYWFGSTLGLCRYKRGVWTRWISGKDIPMIKIFTMTVDNENNLWFADRNSGLARMDSQDRIKYYNVKDGLISDEVWDLKIDAHSRLWAATAGGLNCFDNGTWLRFDARTGLAPTQIWPILPLGDTIYVGPAGAGLAVLNLRDCAQPLPQVLLENPVTENGTTLLRWHPLSYWGEPAPEEILTRYKVDNEQWSPWTTSHSVSLHGLASRDYKYTVQVQNLIGQFDSTGFRSSFTIVPPLYLRPFFILPVGGSLVLALGFGILYLIRRKQNTAALLTYQAQLRSLTKELSSTEELQRRHIAVYLHDTVGQTLALCKIKLEGLHGNGVKKDIEEVCSEIERLIEQTQSLTFELCPPILYELGLIAALEWLVQRMQTDHALTVSIRDNHVPKSLGEELNIFLFRAVQELLVNTVKHGRATIAGVSLEQKNNAIMIVVEDNGVGFDVTTKNNRAPHKGGYGLFNLTERATYLGGTIKVDSAPGHGTRVTITVPVVASGETSSGEST